MELVALDGTAPIAAVGAVAVRGGAVNAAAIDTRGFRFGKLTDYLDANFLPGGAKYGDLPGFLSLAAPTQAVAGGRNGRVGRAGQSGLCRSGKPTADVARRTGE